MSFGLSPGIIGFSNDGQRICVPCAREIYGSKATNDVVDCKEGWRERTDHEGNRLNAIFADSDHSSENCDKCGNLME